MPEVGASYQVKAPPEPAAVKLNVAGPTPVAPVVEGDGAAKTLTAVGLELKLAQQLLIM